MTLSLTLVDVDTLCDAVTESLCDRDADTSLDALFVGDCDSDAVEDREGLTVAVVLVLWVPEVEILSVTESDLDAVTSLDWEEV